jgi:hypothetical protein
MARQFAVHRRIKVRNVIDFYAAVFKQEAYWKR